MLAVIKGCQYLCLHSGIAHIWSRCGTMCLSHSLLSKIIVVSNSVRLKFGIYLWLAHLRPAMEVRC